jgi:putative RecB family exonuclease
MTCYSHSRLSQFESCRFAYDLHYNQGYKSPYETIEAYLGKRVHETLEKLYTDLQNDKLDTLDELLEFYEARWDGCWHDYVVNTSRYDDYKHHDDGVCCIANYYSRFYPFDQMSIAGLETDEELLLPDGNTWSIRIDKFAFKGDTFYVCDYKTANRMKSQYDADSDRQLAMYAKWVRDRYGKDKKVKLIWHMLKFDKDVESSRTNYELDRLVDSVVKEIHEIEACTDWSPQETPLCNWCVYKDICPLFITENDITGDLI